LQENPLQDLESIVKKPIYLDYNATTPIAPEAIKAMLPYLYEEYGNPSSSHAYGVRTKKAVEDARRQAANLLNCNTGEIIFTSGGTESNNMAIRGAALINRERGNHIVTCAIEHPAVMEVCKWLTNEGFKLTILPVDGTGMVDPVDLRQAITEETILVSIMQANNEVGTLQPIQTLVNIAHDKGALFHTDVAQAVGKIDVNMKSLGVDLLSVAGHKLYAPKGVGVLYVKKGVELPNLMFGAGHEKGRRPGTENVMEIAGFGAACQIISRELKDIQTHYAKMRDRLHQGLENVLGENVVRLNGHPTLRLPNTLSLCFYKIAANRLLTDITEGVAASAGSACHADQVSVSSVLSAMQVPINWAMGTIRFSVGRGTTSDEVDQAIGIITKAVQKLQQSP